MAAQLAAATALAADPDWWGELVVQVVADEEDGSRLGAEHLLELGVLQADGAIVAEPTGCVPSLAQLGNAWAEVVISGRAAHAGRPDRGVDAFRAALDYVAAVDELLRLEPTDPQFPGHPRLNIGDFAMDGHPGTVPGECRLRCDIRVLPGRERERVLGLYERAAESVRRECGVAIAVERYRGGGCQSHRIEPSGALAQAFHETQIKMGQPARTLAFSGGTDARYFAMAGTPAVVYGPGSLDQAHHADEFVPVQELRLAARQLAVVAAAFLTGVPPPAGEGR